MTTDLEKPSTSYASTGKGVGDFDFLEGGWNIRHKRLKEGTKDIWQHFESSGTVHLVLGGMGSVEELRKTDGSPMGMGFRVWRSELEKWADHWTDAETGVVNAPSLVALSMAKVCSFLRRKWTA